MCGSDPGDLTPPRKQARAGERVFRAPLLTQLRHGAWPFTLVLFVPYVIAVGALIYDLATGRNSGVWLVGVAVAMLIHLVIFTMAAIRRESKRLATCSWIALGDGYIRLGMSFLRPKVLFEQIVEVERGKVAGRSWQADANGAQAQVRFVLRHGWETVGCVYPLRIDPSGELTAALRAAAARTRDRLGIREGATEEEVSAVFRRLEEAYRAKCPVEKEEEEEAG